MNAPTHTAPTAEPASMRSVMEGNGFYNANSQIQATAIVRAFPLLERAAALADPSSGRPILIADYGSSQGRNSLEPVSRAIRILRQRLECDAPINVVHIDQPANDFNALFNVLETDPKSYTRHDPAVFTSVVGRSFYHQVLPSESVRLGWSSYAVNWLSQVPPSLRGFFWPDFATDAARDALACQLAADWRRFLTLRARELQPGGRMVVSAPLRTLDQGSDLDPLMRVARSALYDLIEEGTLRYHEFRRMAIPAYGRTLEEYQAPFREAGDIGLCLEECQPIEISDPCWERFLVTGDAEELASSYAGFFRAVFNPALLVHLDADRDPADHETISGLLSEAIKGRIMSDPAQLIRLRIAALLIAKPGC